VADPVGRAIKKSLLNPALSLPLWLLSNYTAFGQRYRFFHRRVLRVFDLITIWGVLRWLNNYLNRRALQNGLNDKYDWSKEVVVVTGGSDGIGKVVVQLLASKNVKVAVLDIQPPTYEVPPSAKYFKCDITSSAVIADVASQVRSELGEPTVLMNIAGVANGKTILDATEAETKWVFDVNSLSHYRLAKEFVPSMVKNNHGMVVTLASLAAYIVLANNVDYSASKAAALTFHEGLTTELVTRCNAPKVRTLLVTPGAVNTSLIRGWQQKYNFFEYLVEPETFAEQIVKRVLVGEGGALTIPGSFNFNAPILRTLPYWMSNPMRNKHEYVAAKWNGRMVEDPNKKYGDLSHVKAE
jgi:all-trans-retinol dehydrogenase (NAD+)